METARRNFGKLFDLSGRAALITGAGAGFGEEIALGFAAHGCDIAVADLNFDSAKGTAQKVSEGGRRSVSIAADVGSRDDVKRMVDIAARELGTIDILVNCAGIPQHDPAEDTPLETWDRVIDVNLRGTFLCCQLAAHVMLLKGKGVMINFSSIAGVVGVGRGANAYC